MTSHHIDFFDDLEASVANGMVPSMHVVVTDRTGHLLLILRTTWQLGAARWRGQPEGVGRAGSHHA
ncbi:hypothetical protein [Spirillospora sp. NBC_01491]|uniref:hypothetical protein n=1 Tax=Spirillospora sp. NBC_01491 TaxID=2976007 RepID=UPI002E33F5B5|nr:hypothetical protein [Spirillospora sp. NBC_01491]